MDRETIYILAIQSIGITIATLGAYLWGLKHFGEENLNGARTMAFATLILAELLRSYSARSDRYTLFHIGPFTNRKLVIATLLSFTLMLAVLYVPALADLFDTIPLGLDGWMVVLPCSLVPLVLGELYKVIRYRGK